MLFGMLVSMSDNHVHSEAFLATTSHMETRSTVRMAAQVTSICLSLAAASI